MSSGIDYSKWDKMTFDSDSSEEDISKSQPRVTRLDQPSRITTTRDGTIQVEPSEQQQQSLSAVAQRSVENVNKQDKKQPVTANSPRSKRPASLMEKWTYKGAKHTLDDGRTLYWTQTRCEVVLRLELPKNIVPRDLQVELSGSVLPYRDRNAAVGVDNAKVKLLVMSKASNILLLQGNLPYPIYWTEEEEEEHDLDWSIEYDANETRILTMPLHKASPMEGMVIWWKRCFEEMNDRVLDKEEQQEQSTNKFQQAWDEAHQQFREKIQKGELHSPPQEVQYE